MKRKRIGQWGLVTGLGLALCLTIVSVQAAPHVTSPDAGTVQVLRATEGNVHEVPYLVLPNGEAIKYEDAPIGLGEDDDVMTDTFVIHVEGGGDSVTVETKAGLDIATAISGVGTSVLDASGFRITLVSIEDDVYTITVMSESSTHALSHVTFTFAAGSFADPLYD